MSIDIKNVTQVLPGRGNDTSRARSGDGQNSASQSSNPSGTDKLTLSGTTQEMVGRLREAMGDAVPVDQQRVEAIRQKLADDTYKVDSLRLAENFLRKEGALPGGS
jgi:flagellar biosynthesis anti-sigma factor FlgM